MSAVPTYEIDILALEMERGSPHWLHPASNIKLSDEQRKEIRDKHRAKAEAKREKEWDESKHPRDPGGKFSESGGGAGGAAASTAGVDDEDANDRSAFLSDEIWNSNPELNNKIYGKLIDATGSGPFDGGCVVMAQALQKVVGGDVVMLASANGRAQHAVVKTGDVYHDFSGSGSAKEIMNHLNEIERLDDDHRVVSIRSEKDGDLPNAPRDDKTAAEIAALINDVEAAAVDENDPEISQMLLVSERPNQEKIDRWREELDKRQSELDTQGLAGDAEDSHINQMQAALNKYMQEPDESLDKEIAGLNVVYDGYGHLRGAAFTYVDTFNIATNVAKIANFGALDQASGLKTLQQVVNKFAGKVDRIESEVWADDKATIAIFEAAGYKQVGGDGGQVTMVKGDLPGGGATRIFEKLQTTASETAKRLDYDPALIQWSNADLDFTLGGKKYKYAGSHALNEPDIVLYRGQLDASNVEGVTAHEIGHAKYDLLDAKHRAEYEAVMKDPDTRAAVKPDGTLRPPYDEKYPIYQEMSRIREMTDPTLAESDGITNYSKSYWEEWGKGKVRTLIAEHETLAEMSKVMALLGHHSANAKQPWLDLYALMEKVWKETPVEVRNKPRAA